MTSTFYFNTILIIIIAGFIFDKILDILNDGKRKEPLPKEVEGLYNEEEYQRFQDYHKTNSRFGLLSGGVSIITSLIMIIFGGFGWLDEWARSYTEDPIFIALLFFGVIALASEIIGLPFSIYSTFVIEEKFGFNKTTPKTFILDRLKGYLLGGVFGGGILALIIVIYQQFDTDFWWLAWIVVILFMVITMMLYATVVLPLFNKLTPLEEGSLRQKIEEYAKKVGFDLQNIFIMDGSKRSTKANAFFSGLGKSKRIVLFDTLIEKNTEEELVAILAHEVGHYKKKHTLTSVFFGIAQTGIMLYILSLFITSEALSLSLGAKEPSFHIGIIAFSILYSPISMLLGIGMSVLSRKNEYEADAYAKETYRAEPLISGLKKLSVDSLSNLNPHSAYVFVHHSHPPLKERIKALS